MRYLLMYVILLAGAALLAQDEEKKAFRDLAYVKDGHPRQKLDLYLPDNPSSGSIPLVIWIHGGGWQKGSKDRIDRNEFILEAGFALASVNYRLTSDATFPAQIHDCKAAVRYLRKNARSFGLDPTRFGAWGASAGGHLVALLGTSGGVEELEGELGVTGVSSEVQAVCDWFGPSDILKIGEYATKNLKPGDDPSDQALYKFMGGPVKENKKKARAASPVSYVDKHDPPFLIMHGDNDELVPLSESEILDKLLQQSGVESELIIVQGAGHGFFKDMEQHRQVTDFFSRQLGPMADQKEEGRTSVNTFTDNWALVMPDGSAGWLSLTEQNGEMKGELWMVGAPKPLTDVSISGNTLSFTHRRALGKPEYVGGPPTGAKISCKHNADVQGDTLFIVMDQLLTDGSIKKVKFRGKRIPPLPPQPDMDNLIFGKAIELFNGSDLEGWRLTNPAQVNCWKAVDGVLINETPKKNFDPFARYGNLRTEGEFTDFNLQIDFNVPEGGNSGIYLRGLYEAQVVDRDSRMQGIHGIGAIFNRILPSGMYGKAGGEWQHYDITLVDRHVTVILNGTKVIDNQPLAGCTNGALFSDESLPGPIYLQGDHTSVSYRNIILRPVIKNDMKLNARGVFDLVPGQTAKRTAQGETGVTYYVHTPENFRDGDLRPVLIAFSPGGFGMGMLNKIREGAEKAGWIVIGCDSLRNNFKNRELALKMEDEILDDIFAFLPHDPERIYMGGFSGGAWRAYDISARREEQFAGILAYGGWLGGKDSQDKPYCENMSVAMINGVNDRGANAWVAMDSESLRKRSCSVKHYACKGGHKVAPPDVTELAIDWLESDWKRKQAGIESETIPLDILLVAGKGKRTDEFKDFLSSHFRSVLYTDPASLNLEMCNSADVLVLDTVVRTLPDGYAKAMLLTGPTAVQTAERYGSKIDELCLCSGSETFNMTASHPVFEGPIPVKASKLRKELSGQSVLLSSKKNFENEKDSEIISSGKGPDGSEGVALLREAHRFLWGFEDSPALMSELTKRAFINSLVWIHLFDGYQQSSYRGLHARNEIIKLRTMPEVQGEELVRWFPQEVLDNFNYDKDEICSYYDERIGYVHVPYGSGQLHIDREAEKLKTPNNEIASLEKWVALLKGEQRKVAMGLLLQYSGQRIRGTANWREWFEENGSSQKFIDERGYRFFPSE